MILSVSQKRKRIATGETIHRVNWDPVSQRAKYVSKKEIKAIDPHIDFDKLPSAREIAELNECIDGIDRMVRESAKRFEFEKIPYSVQMLADAFKSTLIPKTKVDQSNKYIFNYIDKYIEENEPSRAKGSLSVYKQLKRHLEAYLAHHRVNIKFEDIDIAFFRSFENFLIKYRSINNITIAKQLSTLKTFIGYAQSDGIKVSDSFRRYKVSRQALEVITLTEDEFLTLYNLDLKGNKRLEQVRDVFCFSCVTGLRWSDLNQLKREHINGMEIRITVQKTQRPLVVPLNVYAYSILEKYSERSRPLPVISNQKFNDYLKELGKMAGIDEPVEIVRYKGATKIVSTHPKYELITVHVGRKTFVTLSLEKGIPAETVMATSGHSDYKSFQRYVNVTEERKRVEMAKAWGAPELKKVIGGTDL